MCELLGISSNRVSNIQFSSQIMQAHSQGQPSGWGVAFYPEESGYCQVFKEPKPMKDSDLFRYLQENKTIGSKNILNHIRFAVGGSRSYENTHPFVRELFGQDWALIHNGAGGIDNYYRKYTKGGEKQKFVPIGTTGSEKALCIILNEINNRVCAETRLEEGSNLRIKVDYDFEDTQRVIYETCRSIQASGASLNILLSNGEYLIAFHSGYNHLHYVLRDGHAFDSRVVTMNSQAKEYFDHIGQETYSLQKPTIEKAAIVATEVLTDGEQWRALNRGDFLVFRDGAVVFRNGEVISEADSPLCIEMVEVYDTSARMDSLGMDVIGVSKRLRDDLEIQVGDKVQVRKHGSEASVVLRVHQTDRRLLKGGTSEADNPDYHVCIPHQIRNRLGLSDVNSAHRSILDAFSRMFETVDIIKY